MWIILPTLPRGELLGGGVVDLLVRLFDRSDLAIVTGFILCSMVGGTVSIWTPCVEVRMEKFCEGFRLWFVFG